MNRSVNMLLYWMHVIQLNATKWCVWPKTTKKPSSFSRPSCKCPHQSKPCTQNFIRPVCARRALLTDAGDLVSLPLPVAAASAAAETPPPLTIGCFTRPLLLLLPFPLHRQCAVFRAKPDPYFLWCADVVGFRSKLVYLQMRECTVVHLYRQVPDRPGCFD